MNNTCPSGHRSDSADFCSDCGIEMVPSPAPVAVATVQPSPISPDSQSGEKCPKCLSERESASGRFCGICGYNYVTGQGGDAALTGQPTLITTNAGPVRNETATRSGANRMDIAVRFDEKHAEAPQGDPVRTFSLFDEENLIGRKTSSFAQTVGLEGDDYVSRRQVLIIRQQDQTFVVRAFANTNGSFLNGSELSTGVDYPLKEGDIIRVGAFTLIEVKQIYPSSAIQS